MRSSSTPRAILRATEAELFAGRAIGEAGAWDDAAATVPARIIDEFAELVGGAATPIDDVRGSAAYRAHGCTVMARRALGWALEDRRSMLAAVG